MKEIPEYRGCFVCGMKNEAGLKARFQYDGEQALTDVTAEIRFEGYKGIYHGGIISTLLDEVMIKAILAQDRVAVTAEMTVKFHQTVRTGEKLSFTGKVIRSKGRVFFTKGSARGEEGQLCASATGKYVEVKEKVRNELLSSLE